MLGLTHQSAEHAAIGRGEGQQYGRHMIGFDQLCKFVGRPQYPDPEQALSLGEIIREHSNGVKPQSLVRTQILNDRYRRRA